MHPWGKWLLLLFPGFSYCLFYFYPTSCGVAMPVTVSNTAKTPPTLTLSPTLHRPLYLTVISHSSVLAPIFQSVWLSVSFTVSVPVSLYACHSPFYSVLTWITQDWMGESLHPYMHNIFCVCILYCTVHGPMLVATVCMLLPFSWLIFLDFSPVTACGLIFSHLNLNHFTMK